MVDDIGNQELTITVSKDSLYFVKLAQMQQKCRAIELENARLRQKVDDLSNGIQPAQNQKKRKVREVDEDTNVFSPYKSNGVLKARASESISSYDDFKKMQDYFLKDLRIRDWCLWTMGVSLGLRVSDLLMLRFRNLLDENNNVLDRIKVYEKKTGKLNNILITDAVAQAIRRYCNSIGWKFNRDWFFFASRKGGGVKPMSCEHGWHIISQAAKEVGLPMHVGSHTMRKSFANIAACADSSTIDMNTITKVQGLLNHKDQTTTMKYLGRLQDMYDKARMAVSDFVLGKSAVNDLVAGDSAGIQAVLDRLDLLENSILVGVR